MDVRKVTGDLLLCNVNNMKKKIYAVILIVNAYEKDANSFNCQKNGQTALEVFMFVVNSSLVLET